MLIAVMLLTLLGAISASALSTGDGGYTYYNGDRYLQYFSFTDVTTSWKYSTNHIDDDGVDYYIGVEKIHGDRDFVAQVFSGSETTYSTAFAGFIANACVFQLTDIAWVRGVGANNAVTNGETNVYYCIGYRNDLRVVGTRSTYGIFSPDMYE